MQDYYPDDFFNAISDAQEKLAAHGVKNKNNDNATTNAIKFETDKLFNFVKTQIKRNMHKRIVLFEIPAGYSEHVRRSVLKQIIDGFVTKAQVYALFRTTEYDNTDWFHTEEIDCYIYKEVQANFEQFPTEMIDYEFCHADLFALEFNEHPTKLFNSYRDRIDATMIDQYFS